MWSKPDRFLQANAWLNTHFLPSCLWKISKWFPSTWCWFGTSPTCRFPPICSYALAVGKGASFPMLSPRDGQALGEGLKENRSLKELWLNYNNIGDSGAQAPRWGGSPKRLDGEVCEEKRRYCRSVCLSAFLVRYVGLLECHWNNLNSFTAGNIYTGWFSHKWCLQFLHLLHNVNLKASRDVMSHNC